MARRGCSVPVRSPWWRRIQPRSK